MILWNVLSELIEKQKVSKKTTCSMDFCIYDLHFIINSVYRNFEDSINREYSYFMSGSAVDNAAGKELIEINLINFDMSGFKEYFDCQSLIKMHSTESSTISYFTNGEQFDRDTQFRNALKTTNENGDIALFGLLTQNIVFYNSNSKVIYVIGEKDHFVECKDIIETVCISFLESKNHLMFHASSCAKSDKDGVLIIGHSGQGKTSLVMNLIYNGGYSFVSNDRVYLKIGDNDITAYGAPLQMAIGLGTFNYFSNLQQFIPKNLYEIFNSGSKEMNKYKIRFETVEFPNLFKQKIIQKANLSAILIPFLAITEKSSMEKLSYEEGKNFIYESLLSPFDENHPKWLGLIKPDESRIKETIDKFLDLIIKLNVNIYKVSMGNDVEEFFRKMEFV